TNFVLGKRMEKYFSLGLKRSRKYRVLAENIQIIKDKITLGEIDFILEDLQTGKTIHVELVYKFYVYDPSIKNEMERWIGPNRKDSLLQKLIKIKDSQFPFLFNSQTKRVLEKLNIYSENIEQLVCFKAQLFIPKRIHKENFYSLNQKCISGYWITFSEFDTTEYFNFLFFAPKKQNWPVQPEYQDIWFSFDEIKLQILKLFTEKKSPLIWMKINSQKFEKFFVVWW